MAKFIIIWDAGYGKEAEIVEAESQEEAKSIAYDKWFEDTQSNADYRAEPYSEDLAFNYDLTDE